MWRSTTSEGTSLNSPGDRAPTKMAPANRVSTSHAIITATKTRRNTCAAGGLIFSLVAARGRVRGQGWRALAAPTRRRSRNCTPQEFPSGVTEKALHMIGIMRSEEHTSELQSQSNLVCRLLLEKNKHT